MPSELKIEMLAKLLHANVPFIALYKIKLLEKYPFGFTKLHPGLKRGERSSAFMEECHRHYGQVNG